MLKIKEIKELIIEYAGKWPMIIAILLSARVLGFLYLPIALFDNAMIICIVLYLLLKGVKLNGLYVAMCAYLPLSILLSQPDPLFKSWPRLGLFILVLLFCSPLIQNEAAKRLRKGLFYGTGICCIMISVISFVCYFLGINYMRANSGILISDYLTNNAGTFGGITTQSMILGPLSGVATLFCAYFALIREDRRFWILCIACIGSLFFSASRSSLIATIVGGIIFLHYFSNDSSIIKKRVLPVIFLAAVTYPIWNGALSGFSQKNAERIEQEGTVNSRSAKWRIRLEEFKDSPLYGIGFVSVSNGDYYEPSSGIIELGSSWLGVLSMTGIIGFLLFCRMFFRAGLNTIKYRTPEGALLAAALALVGVHMMAEGHIFAGGSHLCFLVWLIIGCCDDYRPE